MDPELQGLAADMEQVLNAAYCRAGIELPKRNGRPMAVQMREEMPARTDEEFIVWLEAWAGFLDILFEQGPHPERVMRRLYALVWAVAPERIATMKQTELALLFKETRAAVSQRVRLIFSSYLAANGFKATRVPGQKRASAVEKYRTAQKGNSNRRAGRKKGDSRNPTKRKA